jgi:hypothetical protein
MLQAHKRHRIRASDAVEHGAAHETRAAVIQDSDDLTSG